MIEVGKTIDLALKLHPETEEIIIIARTEGITRRLNDERYRAAARDVEGRVQVTFWNDLSLQELKPHLLGTGPGQLVFLGSELKTDPARF